MVAAKTVRRDKPASYTALSVPGWCDLFKGYTRWWNSTGSQEPVLGISSIPRTACWVKSGVLNYERLSLI